jgi:hypothetical protein
LIQLGIRTIQIVGKHPCKTAFKTARKNNCTALALSTLGHTTRTGLVQFVPCRPMQVLGASVKAGLQCSNYRSKLVHLEAQKNIFYVKKALVWSDFCHSINHHFTGIFFKRKTNVNENTIF